MEPWGGDMDNGSKEQKGKSKKGGQALLSREKDLETPNQRAS